MTKEDDDTCCCLERARMDLELLTAAFPDEIIVLNQDDFPLQCRLLLNNDSYIEMEFIKGYPITSTLQVISQRCHSNQDRVALEAAVLAIKSSASLGEEHGLACCAAALQAWNDSGQENVDNGVDDEEEHDINTRQQQETTTTTRTLYNWFTGTQSLTDRKSVFVAHVCKVESEQQVQEALHQLLDGNSKLQRATHNMVAWRVTEVSSKDGTTVVEKHDNDDDGETGAGSRLAHLLQMRNECNIVVVVSRWYGGIHLGSKRFAHISHVAQQALQEYHIKEERQKNVTTT